jgi:hypothetical protein
MDNISNYEGIIKRELTSSDAGSNTLSVSRQPLASNWPLSREAVAMIFMPVAKNSAFHILCISHEDPKCQSLIHYLSKTGHMTGCPAAQTNNFPCWRKFFGILYLPKPTSLVFK